MFVHFTGLGELTSSKHVDRKWPLTGTTQEEFSLLSLKRHLHLFCFLQSFRSSEWFRAFRWQLLTPEVVQMCHRTPCAMPRQGTCSSNTALIICEANPGTIFPAPKYVSQ